VLIWLVGRVSAYGHETLYFHLPTSTSLHRAVGFNRMTAKKVLQWTCCTQHDGNGKPWWHIGRWYLTYRVCHRTGKVTSIRRKAPTIARVGFSAVFVCLFVCLFVCFSARHLKIDAARITKLGIEMFQHGSWKFIYFGIKRSKVKVTKHIKHCRRESRCSCECWLLLVVTAVRWCSSEGVYDSVLIYTVSKKQTPWFLIIISANVDQFSKFCHRQIPEETLYTHIIWILHLWNKTLKLHLVPISMTCCMWNSEY